MDQLLNYVGAIFGTAGVLLGWLSYRRDSTKISVSIMNDWSILNHPIYKDGKYTIVDVTNTGRRPVTIQYVCLVDPNGKDWLLVDGLIASNRRLEESSTTQYLADQTEMPPPIALIQAFARTTCGTFWYSDPINLKQRIQFKYFRFRRYLSGKAY